MRQVRRRRLLLATCALLSAPLARAQAAGKLPTLGILNPHPKPAAPKGAENPVTTALSKHGWTLGKNIVIESPDAGGNEARLPELAVLLVAKKVDAIWALGPEAAVAAARATKTIPIVFWGVAYPVEQGLVESFARPGGNVTGVAWYAAPEVDGKRLELLREIAPAARRLAFLSVPTTVRTVEGWPAKIEPTTTSAARKLGYELRRFSVEKPDDFEPAFAAILQWDAQALTVAGTTLTLRERDRIVAFANRNRLPSAFTLRDFVEAGGLVSYAIDWRPTMARSIDLVDRILRGAKPADLPVELPTRYETAVNLLTAKALGLTVPQTVLLRADRMIE